jgi:hypothetical protein
MSLGVLGAGAATVSAAVLEPIRHAFSRSLPRPAAGHSVDHSVDDWEEIADEYAHAYLTTPLTRLLPDLAADVVTLQHLIGTTRDAAIQRALCRPGGRLALLMAKTVSALGDQRAARHWWQTARHTADAADDPELRALVRGEEAVTGLYEHRPRRLLEQRIDEALSIGNGGTYAGMATALAARAQLLATMGRPTAAVAALHEVEAVYERLPDVVTADDASTFGWTVRRLHHTTSFVHTRLGHLPEATEAQDQALALYPASQPRERAKIQLHQADCLVRTGNVTDGIGHATAVLQGLPGIHRTMMVLDVATAVLDGIPDGERDRPLVRDYRELIAQPPAPTPPAISTGDA